MSNVLRIALVDPNDGTRETLKAMLLGMDTVWLEADCSRYEFFPDVIEQTGPDVGVISLDSNPDKAIELIQRLGQEAPETSLLVASGGTDGHLILRTIRAGAKEFLTLPVSEHDLSSALQRVSQQKFGSTEGGGRSCQVIAIAGATGGVGTTSTAVIGTVSHYWIWTWHWVTRTCSWIPFLITRSRTWSRTSHASISSC
jgi:pilus assembly protein CpaE